MSSTHLSITGYPDIAANITSLNQCTPQLCSLDYAIIRYILSITANAIVAGVFVVLLAIQAILWLLYRAHRFSFLMCCGLLLEVLGYFGAY